MQWDTSLFSWKVMNTKTKGMPLRYKLFLGLMIAVLASLGAVYAVATLFLVSDEPVA